MRRGLCSGVRALVAGGLVPALAVAAGGCGGSGGNSAPACLQVQPCGGDVVGTWSFLGGCINVTALNAETQLETCPGRAFAGASIAISGSGTYRADLTYTFDVQQTITLATTIPLSCSTSTSCSAIAAEMALDDPNAVITCTGTTTCSCVTSVLVPRTVVNGTYTTAGTTIQLTSDATATTSSYCVQGDLMHLMNVSSTQTGPVGEAVILVDDVAQKQ